MPESPSRSQKAPAPVNARTPSPLRKKEHALPPTPTCPLPERPSKKDLIGRSFYDDGDFDYDGNATYQPGEFVVKSIKTGGYLICVRVDDRSDIQKYKLADVLVFE